MTKNTRNEIIRGGGGLIVAIGFIALCGFTLNEHLEKKALGLTVTRSVLTDKSIAMRIKGLVATSTVAIAAGGDMAFTTDGTTTDDSISTDGTIDLSTPAVGENTMGEVCDIIDADDNWECELVDALPSWSTDNILSTLAETDTVTGLSATYDLDGSGLFATAGLAVTYNTADLDKASAAISIAYADNDIYQTSQLYNRNSRPHTGAAWRSELYKAVFNGTVTTGAPDVKIWLVRKNDAGTYAGCTEQLLWQQTGVDDETDVTLDFTDLPPIATQAGSYIVAVYDDTTTADMTTQRITVHGLAYQH